MSKDYILPLNQIVETPDGLKFQRIGEDSVTYLNRDTVYPALPEPGKKVELGGWDLYFIKNNSDVIVRVVPLDKTHGNTP